MASSEELAQEYAKQIHDSVNPASEVHKVAEKINSLVFTRTQAPLSKSEKDEIADLIGTILTGRKSVVDNAGRTWILKEADNKKYLELVGALKDLLK